MQQTKKLYAMKCAACHEGGGLGPELDGIAKSQTMPSGKPATEENLRNRILKGSDQMPAFDGDLTKEQVDALIDYLRTPK